MVKSIEEERPAAAQEEPYPSPGYAWYVVGVLTLVYVFSFIDRQILTLLVVPIRRDLNISETQMGLLMGTSFAVFYTFFGVLLGRLADTRSRRTIIALGFIFWSLMTAACGLARNFAQMLLYRVGVGVGEAALSPAAYSMIADYFPPERRATAISVYSMGIYLGSGLAMLLGGVVVGFASSQEAWALPIVGETRPWQIIFFIVGMPGILLALLMYTVREPLRRGLKMIRAADGSMRPAHTPLKEVFAYIARNRRTFLCHNVGFALLSLTSYGGAAWIPTLYVRRHGWTAAEVGIAYGIVVLIFGTIGIVAGGRLADHLAARGQRDATIRVGIIGTLIWIPAVAAFNLAPSGWWATVWLMPTAFGASMPFGVAPAAVQQMMPNAMRGQASAIYLFVVNLIGLGLGPLAVGVATEYIFGESAIHYSLLVVGLLAQGAALVVLWAGLKPYIRSLDYLRDWTAANR